MLEKMSSKSLKIFMDEINGLNNSEKEKKVFKYIEDIELEIKNKNLSKDNNCEFHKQLFLITLLATAKNNGIKFEEESNIFKIEYFKQCVKLSNKENYILLYNEDDLKIFAYFLNKLNDELDINFINEVTDIKSFYTVFNRTIFSYLRDEQFIEKTVADKMKETQIINLNTLGIVETSKGNAFSLFKKAIITKILTTFNSKLINDIDNIKIKKENLTFIFLGEHRKFIEGNIKDFFTSYLNLESSYDTFIKSMLAIEPFLRFLLIMNGVSIENGKGNLITLSDSLNLLNSKEIISEEEYYVLRYLLVSMTYQDGNGTLKESTYNLRNAVFHGLMPSDFFKNNFDIEFRIVNFYFICFIKKYLDILQK